MNRTDEMTALTVLLRKHKRAVQEEAAVRSERQRIEDDLMQYVKGDRHSVQMRAHTRLGYLVSMP
jgi:hypothetical protein